MKRRVSLTILSFSPPGTGQNLKDRRAVWYISRFRSFSLAASTSREIGLAPPCGSSLQISALLNLSILFSSLCSTFFPSRSILCTASPIFSTLVWFVATFYPTSSNVYLKSSDSSFVRELPRSLKRASMFFPGSFSLPKAVAIALVRDGAVLFRVFFAV